MRGGFPEAIARDSERRRQDWARSYLTSILTRDLVDIADIEKLTELPKFVRMLAEYSSQLVNYSQFGASINVSHKTGQRYVGLLEQVFLIAILQPAPCYPRLSLRPRRIGSGRPRDSEPPCSRAGQPEFPRSADECDYPRT